MNHRTRSTKPAAQSVQPPNGQPRRPSPDRPPTVETDHRPLALELTRAAIARWRAATREASSASARYSEAGSAIEAEAEDSRAGYERVRRWESWTTIGFNARHDAARQLTWVVAAWDAARLSVNSLNHPGEDWPLRGIILDGTLFLCVPNEGRDAATLVAVDMADVVDLDASEARPVG